MCRDALRSVLRLLRSEVPEPEREQRARLAAAALLVECARADASVEESERREIALAVRELFDLEDDVADALLAVAEKRVDDVWDDWLFTHAVRSRFDLDARSELVRRLCDVAHANGLLHRREDAFIRRIARELGVPDERVKACRREAQAARKGAV